jgi:hypothetical protein
LCGRLPSPAEFVAESVLDRQHVAAGEPFWLSLKVCGGAKYQALEAEINRAKKASKYWTRDMRGLARDVWHWLQCGAAALRAC